jgi:hypothetical protein
VGSIIDPAPQAALPEPTAPRGTRSNGLGIGVGDTLTLAEGAGPLGFAVDYIAAVERDGELICEAVQPPSTG